MKKICIIAAIDEEFDAIEQIMKNKEHKLIYEIEIIEAVPENAPSLFIYQYNVEEETEIDFLFQIENSEYAGVFMSFSTYEEAKVAFDRVSFVVFR